MALSQKALQKKREKKKNTRVMHQAKRAAARGSSLAYNKWPLFECWVAEDLWENGIGHVLISRKNTQGDIAVGMYLLDVFCLGVKDCFIRMHDLMDYRTLLQNVRISIGAFEAVDASYAATLVRRSIEYAAHIGFKPHPDFIKAQLMLHNIPIDDTLEFNFGKDNKPFYIRGPHESKSDVTRIMNTLQRHLEPGHFDFLLEVQAEADELL